MNDRDTLSVEWARSKKWMNDAYCYHEVSFCAGYDARDAELAAKDARIKELGSMLLACEELNAGYICEIARLKALVEKAEEAFHNLLSNASLDWYVQQFRRTEAPSGNESGAVATIHNRETERRAIAAFELARKALAKIRGGGG